MYGQYTYGSVPVGSVGAAGSQAQTYTHTPSGGSVSGGITAIAIVVAIAVAGGSVAGGTAPVTIGATHTAVGGAIAGGSGLQSVAFTQSSVGGSVTGGVVC